MAKRKATAKVAKNRRRSSAASASQLQSFFRDLYSNPSLMERFNGGRENRRQVLERSNLTKKHRDLLTGGCVPEIIRSLVGAPRGARIAANSTVIECDDTVTCGHVQCEAFSNAVKLRA
jgi:hypothetical protein